jgi:hypothetical protein
MHSRRGICRFAAPSVILTGLLLTDLAPLAAQSVQGRVVATGGETALGGALVQLLDSTGTVVGRAASSPSGGFSITAPAAGTYRLVVRQIGQEAWNSGPLELAAGATIPLTIRLAPRPYTLPEITVTARRRRCDVRIGDDDLLGRLLDAAGTALGVAEAAVESRSVGFSTDTWLKHLSADLVVEDSTPTDAFALTEWPIRSADPDSLRAWGFVRVSGKAEGPTYYGPDARVLFSRWFLAEHCFTAVPVEHGLVQLRFEPESREQRGALSGRLVIDQTTLELRELEYRYVGLPKWVPRETAGGRIQLRRLPSGAWVPYTWSLRAPVPYEVPGRTRLRLHGWVELGGRVTGVHGEDGRVDSALTAALLGETERARRY